VLFRSRRLRSLSQRLLSQRLPRPPSRSLPRRRQPRRSRPRRLRKSIATPTNWRGRPSNVCAAPAIRRTRRRPRASRMRPVWCPRRPWQRPSRLRFGRCRRRSWFPRPPPRRSIRRRGPYRRGPLTPLPPASTIRAVRPRRPTFRTCLRPCHPPDRSICGPRRSNRSGGNTPMSPKTCCWRRSRCSTRYCRNNSIRACRRPGRGRSARLRPSAAG
jgi:hypothetical protein